MDVLQFKGHLLTAGRDGALRSWTWNKNMDNDGNVQLPKSDGGLRSLLLTPPSEEKGAGLVIGTMMNSLLGVTLSKTGSPLDGVNFEGVPITQGHTGEVCDIAKIPASFLGADVLTVSTDGLVCKLNSERREPVWRLWLQGCVFSCVDCNVRGDTVVLGTKDGRLIVLELNPESLTVKEVYNKKVTPGEITAVKLSPDERMLTLGATDRCLHIFHLQEKEDDDNKGKEQVVEEEWVYFGMLKGHKGPIHSVDWSKEKKNDTYIIRTSTKIPEQKFWEVTRCVEISGDNLNDFPWSSSTCLLDHKLVGLWSSKQASEGQLTCVDVNPDETLVAMATNSGSLSLFQYPCLTQKAFSHAYKSHQTPRALCFTLDGRSLLTVGGADTSIMQWKIV
ncbi:echinoderm microtubule-associated protein-like 1 [Plakobranchus ocellatus]|uniref:Echinoderm microtubule-associated protein-like 1 n=1 Tax=Plakobranchus ocellatus TaxID=259542 RepID=A0AAV4B5S8_9GAST|nr:echinoderm microtubule-associated protein-like 1 [Plakobranchus ocellatus]